MTKKNLLIFQILILKNNLNIIKSNFNVFKVKSLKEIRKLNEKIKNKIEIIYCDPLYYYSKTFLKQFKKLNALASSTTSTDFIDINFVKKKR